MVTGAGRGIGEALARGVAEAGADVAIVDIGNKERSEAIIKDIESNYGGDAFYQKTDVTDLQAVEECVRAIEDRWGRLDILVNNAGICINTPAESTTEEEWLKVINLNLNAVFYCSRAASRLMIRQKSGAIINVGSMSGYIVNYPQPQASYNVAKAGVHMMTKSLAVEWGKYNIRVNAIAPGYVHTDLTKPFQEKFPEDYEKYWIEGAVQKRMGQPDELAGAVIYLASDAATYATGSVFVIDGGYSLR